MVLSLEQKIRLGTLVMLSAMFTTVAAIAEKTQESPVKKESQEAVMSVISLIHEAELINSGAYHSSILTKIDSDKKTK